MRTRISSEGGSLLSTQAPTSCRRAFIYFLAATVSASTVSRQASFVSWQAVCLFPTGINSGSRPFLGGFRLRYYCFLNGLCHGLVDSHPGDETT